MSAHAAGVKCGHGKEPVPLAFGRMIKRKQKRNKSYIGFRTDALHIARRLGISLTNLMTVMYYETKGTFDPSKYSDSRQAVGLIQFTQAALDDMNPYFKLHLTLDKLAAMSPREQLTYVEKYLRLHQEKYNRDLSKLQDLYLSILHPGAVGLPPHKLFLLGEGQAEELYVPGKKPYTTPARVRHVLFKRLRKGKKPKNTTTYCIWPWQRKFV